MIFNVDNENLNQTESYKERNLYYKIFAGYLFNELIPGKDQRTTDFLHLLADTLNITERYRGDKGHVLGIINAINSQPVHVTFDYHSAQVIKTHKKDDRGEMSDVLLLQNPILFLSNANSWRIWNLKKMCGQYRRESGCAERRVSNPVACHLGDR